MTVNSAKKDGVNRLLPDGVFKCLWLILLLQLTQLAQAQEVAEVRIHNQQGLPTFTVELADNEDSRAAGLMHRTELAADQGMLFIYPQAEMRHFWMKNTRIPLDILFIGADWKITHIAKGQPLSTRRISSMEPAKYVLEINQGLSEDLDINPGNAVQLMPLISH